MYMEKNQGDVIDDVHVHYDFAMGQWLVNYENEFGDLLGYGRYFSCRGDAERYGDVCRERIGEHILDKNE